MKAVDQAARLRGLVRHVMVDFAQMQAFERDPLILVRGEGIHVWDVEGRKYLDGLSGVYTVNVGHGNQRVIQAMVEQLGRIAFAAPTLATNERALELAGYLVGFLPSDMTVVKFHSGGSEACEAAIKIARQYHRQTGSPNKFKIIGRYRGFHGATLGALSAGGIAGWQTSFQPLAPGFLHAPPPDGRRCVLNPQCPPCQLSCANLIESMIEGEGPDTVAAVIAEPVMLSAGMLVPPREYLQRLREICTRHNVVLIFDEIITGFGRLGARFAADYFGVWPDLICLGKGITSGYAPLSAVGIRDHIANAFRGEAEERVQFQSGHTYGGNPVSSAAAMAAIAELEERGLATNALEMGKRMRTGLEALRSRHDCIREVRGAGLLIGLELVGHNGRDAEQLVRRTVEAARKRGLLLRAGRLPPFVINIGPPLIIDPAQVDELVAIIDQSLSDASVGALTA